jgi:hypothetical protein
MRVYIVTECNRSDFNYIYPYAYSTYASALSAVQEKYPREFEESKEADTAHDLYGVEEDESGTTKLYIEKGIHIKVSKLLVVL